MGGEQLPSKALLNILPNEALWLARAAQFGPELVIIATPWLSFVLSSVSDR